MPSSSSPSDKYRGATIEDLDPPPSLSLTPDTPISTALSLAYERDYTHLCVVSAKTRALLGYISIPTLTSLLSSPNSTHKDSDPVSSAMLRFQRKSVTETTPEEGEQELSSTYTVITPQTGLRELERFFEGDFTVDARTGERCRQEFAIVTDGGRKFVLGVVTRADLEEWGRRRGSVGGE